MPFVPVDQTLMVEAVFEYNGQIVENTYYFTMLDDWTEGDVSAILTAIKNIIVSDLMPLLAAGIKLVKLVGTLLDAVDSLSLVLNVSPPVAGSGIATPLPNNVSYTITFLTAARGRSSRGRNYIAGFTTDDQLDANHIEEATRTGLLSFYDELRAVGSDAGATMVVVSRFSGVDENKKPIPRTSGVTHAVTGFTTADNVLDSQRRRLPGRGT